jgi:TonB-linked SusC/RagA family outer membrane protein
MKKKLLHILTIKNRTVRKIHLTMRFTLLFTLLFCLQLSAKVYSQRDVTLKFNNKEVKLNRLFETIESQSSYRFFFNNNLVPVNKTVLVTDGNVAIEDVLQSALKKFNLNFKILPNNVIIVAPINETIAPIKIKGRVSDKAGLPLPGVSVKIKGLNKGTVTDVNGSFEIDIPDNAMLLITYVGFQTQEVAVSGKTMLDITMIESPKSLNEVVVVGYGTQKRTSVTAAISSVGGDELLKSPVANVSNALGGRVSGVLSRQSSGEPGADADQIQIRGIGTTGNSAPLVVVDGVPMSYDQINFNDIESVTVLKDAAAVAPYGLGGANGVILVTTKRGKAGKTSLNYSGYYGFQQPTAIPHYLDAADFATQFNIANKDVGIAPTYTNAQIQSYKNGSDPDHFPNTNWVNQVLQPSSPITNHNLTFTGGSDKVHFFGDLGYLYQEGIVNVINYKRYTGTLNVDAEVTPTTTVSFDVRGGLTQQNNPAGTSGTGIITSVTEISPTFPLQFSNGQPANALLPSIYDSGYNKNTDNLLNAKFQVEQKLPFIPGLSIKGVAAYEKNNSLGKIWALPYTYYSLSATNTDVAQPGGPPTPTLNETFTQVQNITLQGYLNYHKTIGKSDISGLVVFERRTGEVDSLSAGRINYAVDLDELSLGSSNKNDLSNSGSSAKSAQVGWVYRANYAYASKYLVELSGRYDGHYYFAPDKRYAFFPAASVGWRLSEEKFIKDNYTWIDNLKIRGSYGKSGNLAGGPFQYLTSYGLTSSYVLGGTSPYQAQGIYENSQANPNITWETSNKADVGFDASLFNGKLTVTADYFKERRSDMLLHPTETIPVEYGIGISEENAGIMDNGGVDLSIGTNQRFSNGIKFNTSLVFSYAKNKLIQTFENSSTYNNPNRRLTGRALNTQFGLKAIGLYQQSDFNSDGTLKKGEPVPTFGPVAPGDIKYADLAGPPGPNGKPTGPDGKIDVNDNTVIGYPLFPQITFGLNTSIAWKGFDLYMLWQGAANSTYYLSDELASPFYNGAKIASYQLNYWTPQNPDAEFPRLTPAQITNNAQTSSFWTRNGSYVRLKTFELGYTLQPSLIKAIKLQSVRVFVSGQNLFTISSESYVDPEIGNSRDRYYLQQKTYTLGLNVGF